MKFHLATDIYFDGTNLSLDISQIVDAATGEVFLSHVDAGAKVIEFFRAKGIDVYDNRAAFEAKSPQLVAVPEAVKVENPESKFFEDNGQDFEPKSEPAHPSSLSLL